MKVFAGRQSARTTPFCASAVDVERKYAGSKTQSVNYFNYFVVMNLNTRDSRRSPIQRLIFSLDIKFMPGFLGKRSRVEEWNIKF
jgi:hypothetical protein